MESGRGCAGTRDNPADFCEKVRVRKRSETGPRRDKLRLMGPINRQHDPEIDGGGGGRPIHRLKFTLKDGSGSGT